MERLRYEDIVMRHFLTLKDFTKDEILEMITLAQKIKATDETKKVRTLYGTPNTGYDI